MLIVMGNHSPYPSSVANCVKPLINKLRDKGFEIDIITNRKKLQDLQKECIDGLNIYRVDDTRAISNNALRDLIQLEKNKKFNLLIKVIAVILKSLYFLKFVFFEKEQQYGEWKIDSTVKKCLELHNEKNYDVVLSISQPFKSHFIVEEFLKQIDGPIRWFVFEFDPFSYNEEVTKSESKRKSLFKDEYRIFNSCDGIFLTPELHKFYNKTPFKKFIDKMVPVPFANLEPISFEKSNVKKFPLMKDKINCFFAGRLYRDIRNPKNLLNTFSKLDSSIHLTLMTNFDESMISRYNTNEDTISLIPLQNRDTAINMMNEVNILVNIGNTVEFQVPGKVFEYMSTGKPIIHFSKLVEDPALVYLKKYPLLFVVNEWEIDERDYTEALENFCMENKDKKLTFQDVTKALVEFSGDRVSNEFSDTLISLLEASRTYEQR